MRRALNIGLCGLLLLNMAYVISGVRRYPMNSIDVVGIWLLKAKAMFSEKKIVTSVLKNPKYSYSHPQYPPSLPFLGWGVYESGGRIDERRVLLIYPAVYAAILTLTYGVMRKLNWGQTESLALTYMYSMFSPLLAQAGRKQAGNADIWLSLIYWAMLFLFFAGKTGKLRRVVALLSGAAALIKTEGILSAAAILFIPGKRNDKLIWTAAALAPFVLWEGAKKIWGIEADYGLHWPGAGGGASRAAAVVLGTAKEMANVRNWYVFWPVMVLATAGGKVKERPRQFALPVLLIMAAGMWGIYTMGEIPVGDYFSGSTDRLLLQLSPFWWTVFAEYLKVNRDTLAGLLQKLQRTF